MRKKLIKNLVIGFGFLNGVWLSIGINPEDELISIIMPFLSELHPLLKLLFIILPTFFTLTTIYTLYKIYKKGGILGYISVFIAFISGAIILYNYKISILLLIISIFLGYMSFKN
ncbi:MAG: hypothetical protein QXL18_02135 [Candidatus Woesearchaeota archaeon]